MKEQNSLLTYTLRLADDALILGHRLSELCSRGPLLEEDLALTNISLDLIGRAQALLDYAAQLEGKGRTGDDWAYRREEHEYRNHLLTELPNGDFAQTIGRILFMATYDYLLYAELSRSTDPQLAAIAAKAVKESRYHMEHATDWTLRLGDGTAESNRRMQSAVDNLWSFTGELFEMDEVERSLMPKGVSVDLITLKAQWQKKVTTTLVDATLTLPAEGYMQTGGLNGVHTEYLGHILSEMQYLQRAYPDAQW